MIEIDKEISEHILALQRDINNLKIKIKIKKIITPISYLLIFIYFCSFAKNFSNNFDMHSFSFLLGILFWITGYFIYMYSVAIIKELSEFENDIREKESEIKETEDFSCYVLSCRQIEAKENGQNIYPEIRYDDSIYVKKEFQNKFEEKRLEYEEKHLGRLKLNPHYLDEKIAKAPIYTYPIHEQELFYKRKNEIQSNNSYKN